MTFGNWLWQSRRRQLFSAAQPDFSKAKRLATCRRFTQNSLGQSKNPIDTAYSKPFRQSHKNDFRDAHAIAEAVQRPSPKQQIPSPKNDLPSETAISASTIVQPAASDEPPKEANKAVVATAGAAWPTLPIIDSSPVTTATIVEETQPATDHANAVQISNGSDLTGNWSMFSYLFLILSGVLAVMAALWLLPRMRVRAKSEVTDQEKLASPYTSS